MKLYIHFGIYKAGSSYIQYICANQRDFLEKNKIYFPTSVEDQKMTSGLISKGNADGLEAALKSEVGQKVTKVLQHWYEDAKKGECRNSIDFCRSFSTSTGTTKANRFNCNLC